VLSLEVGLPVERYFNCGDVADLKKKMQLLWGKALTGDEKHHFNHLLAEKYNWDEIARQTIEVYKKVLSS
jgi:glycosyltransferase involved in cell wall biosynthesis